MELTRRVAAHPLAATAAGLAIVAAATFGVAALTAGDRVVSPPVLAATTPASPTDAAQVAARLSLLAEQLRDDPVAAAGALPAGLVRTMRTSGGGDVSGTIAQRADDGRCFAVTVTFGERWVRGGDRSAVHVTGPEQTAASVCTPPGATASATATPAQR